MRSRALARVLARWLPWRLTAALERLLRVAGDVGLAALHMLGDQHIAVEDPDQMLRHHRLHRLPGQHDRHPIPEPRQGDQAVRVHPPLHPGQPDVPDRPRRLWPN